MSGNLIAFDIGESRAKLVWYSGKTRKKAVSAALPDNLVSNGEILSMDAMADFLRQTAKDASIPRAAAAVILPASLVFTRTVEVPAMTDAQLLYNLPYEFKDYLGQEKSSYYFDYAVQELVRDEETQEVRQMKLFACATLKKTIEDYRDMFRRAGFRLKSAIPEEAAYAALMDRRTAAEEDTCFVDIGYNAVRMQIFRGKNFSTRRTVNLGLRDVVQTLADTRGVDAHMAHEHFLNDYEGALSDPGVVNIYHSMAAEIMKAVNFYNYNNREQTLTSIHLCGGGAAVVPIRSAIAELTNMEIRSAAEFVPGGDSIEEPWLFVKAAGCALQA